MGTVKELKNEFGIDLLKVMAMFFVISLHYFLNSGYYEIEDVKIDIIIHVAFRALFYQCVPLFLMITGYLKRKSKFCADHFIKATPILINALIISGITIAYKILYLKESFSVLAWAQSVWSFNQPSYEWYINLYLSLLFFMPFINAAYDSLKSKKQKRIAVVLCVLFTTLATTINRIPTPEGIDTLAFPLGYFSGMWPFAYYVVGKHIGETKPKISKSFTGILAIFGCVMLGVANYKTVTTNYYSGFCVENGDIINVIIATLVFLTFYDLKINNYFIRWIFAKLSILSLCVFLMSCIFDNLLYNHYISQFAGYSSYFSMFWKIVPLDFALSVLASIPISYIGGLISKDIMSRIRRGLQYKKTIKSDQISVD